ncbi:hypothetical protein [Kitasatospora griseola]|uniref:hypothetical protein n=1 Tax=Kitasatospora griseola TaxID=2064 RepID=UPI0038230C67
MTTDNDTRDTTGTQTTAAGALLAMLHAHPDLPTGNVRLELLQADDRRSFEWGITVRHHDALDAFEQWRAALGFDPDRVALTCDDFVNWLEVKGTWCGVPVEIIGYFTSADPESGL